MATKGHKKNWKLTILWEGQDKPLRRSYWTEGGAKETLIEVLVRANRTGRTVEIEFWNAETGETFDVHHKCDVCTNNWATEETFAWSTMPEMDHMRLCRDCYSSWLDLSQDMHSSLELILYKSR